QHRAPLVGGAPHVLDRRRERGHRGEPVGWVLGQRAHHELLDRGGSLRIDLAWPRREHVNVRRDELAPAVEIEWRTTEQQLHHDVGAAIGVMAKVEDLDETWMLDLCGGSRLVEEPCHELGISTELREQYLDRSLATDQLVLGHEHLAHTALADRGDDSVAA